MLVGKGANKFLHVVCCLVLLSVCSLLKLEKVGECIRLNIVGFIFRSTCCKPCNVASKERLLVLVGIILSMLVCAQTFHLDIVNPKTDK